MVGATADEVLALLALADIEAEIAEDGTVEVAQADAAVAAELLAPLAPGELAVRVADKPPS